MCLFLFSVYVCVLHVSVFAAVMANKVHHYRPWPALVLYVLSASSPLRMLLIYVIILLKNCSGKSMSDK